MPADDGTTTVRDLTLRPHSWREYEPREFIEAAKNDGDATAREELCTVESGRFYPMLKAAHKFFAHLDPDERQDWARQNSEMMEWIGAYGALEHLNTYEEYSGISPLR